MNNFTRSVNATDVNPSGSHHFEVHAATVVVLVIPILVMMSLVAMYFQQRLATTNTAAPSLMALFRDSMDKKTHDADGTAALTKSNSSVMSGMNTRSSLSASSNNKGSTRYHKHNNFHQPHPTEMDEALSSPERGFHETIDIEDLQWDREPSHTNQVTTTLSSSISVLHKSMSSISSSTTFQAWLTPSTSTSTSLTSDCSSSRSTAPSTPFNHECDTPTSEASETHSQATFNRKPSSWRLSWPSLALKTKAATTLAMHSVASDDKPAYAVTLIPIASQPLGVPPTEDFVTIYDDTMVLRSTMTKPWVRTTHRPRTATATAAATATMSSSYMLQL